MRDVPSHEDLIAAPWKAYNLTPLTNYSRCHPEAGWPADYQHKIVVLWIVVFVDSRILVVGFNVEEKNIDMKMENGILITGHIVVYKY